MRQLVTLLYVNQSLAQVCQSRAPQLTAAWLERLFSIRSKNTDSPRETTYQFDWVSSPSSTTHAVYLSAIDPLVSRILLGENASIILFGARRSGKTELMNGTQASKSLNERNTNRKSKFKFKSKSKSN
jgi:hypothetical protein